MPLSNPSEQGIGGFDALCGPVNNIPTVAGVLDLNAATGNLVTVTGAGESITSVLLAPGKFRYCLITTEATWEHSSLLLLPANGQNILGFPGDFAIFAGYSGGVVRCISYTKVKGGQILASGIGEYIEIPGGDSTHPISLNTGEAINVVEFGLTVGAWDVDGLINYVFDAASISEVRSGASSVSADFDGDNTFANLPFAATGLSNVLTHRISRRRIVVETETLYFLVGRASFALGSVSAYGVIQASRAMPVN